MRSGLILALAQALLPICLLVTTPTVAAHEQGKPYGSAPIVRLSNNRPAIQITLNGQGPFLFLIDTATSNTVLTPALRQQLNIPVLPGPQVNVVTAAGAVRSNYYSIAEIGLPGVTVEGTRAVVINLPDELGVAGALGADVLSNFIVDLDMKAPYSVTFYPYNAQLRLSGLRRVRGELNDHGFIVVPARVSNIFAASVFDSGAQFTVANSRVAAYARSIGIKTVERPTQHSVTDAARKRQWAVSHDFDRISLGPATWRQVRVMISDMRVFEQIGLAGQPAIFIGMDLMVGRRIVIDYGTASLWIAPDS